MNIKKTNQIIVLVAGIGGVVMTANAGNINTTFGQAANYNAFVFANFQDSGSDVGGNLAVGGTVSVASFGLGQSPIVSAPEAGFYSYVGIGSLTGTINVQNTAGNVYYTSGGHFNGTTQYLANSGGTFNLNGAQSVTTNPAISSGINFITAKTSLQSYSTFLSTQANTATPSVDAGGGYDISATTTSKATIVTLTAAQLQSGSLHITISAGATLLINVQADGSGNASTSTNGIFINGSQVFGDAATLSEYIVFNFTGTGTFNSNETLTGTLLAPYATVHGSGQQIDGGMIANNFTGNNEFHDELFQGSLPSQASTPEPLSFILLGSGLIALGTLTTRRRTKD